MNDEELKVNYRTKRFVFEVTMGDGIGAKALVKGCAFSRKGQKTHLMKITHETADQLKRSGFIVSLSEKFEEAAPERKPVRLSEASEAELNEALIKKNLPVDGSVEDKIKALREANVAWAKREE